MDLHFKFITTFVIIKTAHCTVCQPYVCSIFEESSNHKAFKV